MKKSKKLTQEKLKELFFYDPLVGYFTRKCDRGNRWYKGDIAGYIGDRYLRIQIEGKNYQAHRLAWLYVYGYFPESDIDHIDRNKTNNKIANLRGVSRSCNIRNTGNTVTNTSGVKGVSYYKSRNRWVVRIRNGKIEKHVGYYKNFDNAVCARLAAEQCLNWSNCDSSSPAYQYVQEMLKGEI